jgi:hypothetical protein
MVVRWYGRIPVSKERGGGDWSGEIAIMEDQAGNWGGLGEMKENKEDGSKKWEVVLVCVIYKLRVSGRFSAV